MLNKDLDKENLNRLEKQNEIYNIFGNICDVCPKITHYISDISEILLDKYISICGRVINYRNSKLFIFIRENGIDLQCYCNVKDIEIKKILKLIDIGDCVIFDGKISKSSTGVLTLFVKSILFASKCIVSVPDQYYIQKYEDIYSRNTRTEYLSFHRPAFCAIFLRSSILKYIRNYFYENNFCEVETPILQKIAGGALAKPFETNYLVKKNIFQLRIAPELYLKRLVISGFTKIFEISKNFRNEGISVSHNPEFSMLETYVTYWKMCDMIKFLIHLFSYVTTNLLKNNIKYLSKDQILFLSSLNFLKLKYYNFMEIINNNFGTNINFNSILTELNKYNIYYDDLNNINIEDLYDDYVSKVFVKNNTEYNFICILNHPKKISPLAKHFDNFSYRFEIYFCGYEIVDGFEENNDVVKQNEIFKKQFEDTGRKFDEDYINDMKLGFPYTTGVGLGLDRFICILLGFKNIKDVITYTD